MSDAKFRQRQIRQSREGDFTIVGQIMCLPFVVRDILPHFGRTHRFAPTAKPKHQLHCYKIKNNGTINSLHHLRLCGKHWNDTRLPATSHHHHPHTQHRRHLRAGVPYDGNRRLRLYATGTAAPPQHNMVNVHH